MQTPEVLETFIVNNIKTGKRRTAMIFSTQASPRDKGTDYLADHLEKINFNLLREEIIPMPNNYYVVMFKKPKSIEIERLKEEAVKNTQKIVELFLKEDEKRNNTREFSVTFTFGFIKKFKDISRKWARKKLTVDMNKCIKCKKCETLCVTKNITVGENVLFGEQCINLSSLYS